MIKKKCCRKAQKNSKRNYFTTNLNNKLFLFLDQKGTITSDKNINIETNKSEVANRSMVENEAL